MNLNELHLQLRLYLLFCYFYTHTHTYRLFCYIWYNSFLWHDENFYPEKHFFIIKSVNTKKDLFLQKIMTNANFCSLVYYMIKILSIAEIKHGISLQTIQNIKKIMKGYYQNFMHINLTPQVKWSNILKMQTNNIHWIWNR